MIEDKKSLESALDYDKLINLPTEWDGKDVWFRAIAKIQKENMRVEFAVYERSITLDASNEKYSVTDEFTMLKDCGSMSRVSKVIEFYPYFFLNEKHIPKARKREQLIESICRSIKGVEKEKVNEMSDEAIKSLVYLIAYKSQKLAEQHNKPLKFDS